MADLVRSTLRLRPDRIIVGEVRGPEALDMLKAWNTGPSRAGSPPSTRTARISALYRIEGLVQEAVVTVPRRLIAEAIDIIVFISGRGLQRRITQLARVAGLDSVTGGYVLADLLLPHHQRRRMTMHTCQNSVIAQIGLSRSARPFA